MTVLPMRPAPRKGVECVGIGFRYTAPRTVLVLLAACALVCVTVLAHGVPSGPKATAPPEPNTIVITATAIDDAGGASVAEVVLTVAPRLSASTLANAKSMADGEIVHVAGLVATSAIGDFADFFYIEEMDRASGIRVAAPPSAVSGLSRRSMLNVIGTLATTANDERQISGPIVIILSTAEPIGPLAMCNAWVGGGDAPGQSGVWQWQTVREDSKFVKKWLPSPGLNNIGVLIQTWGKVTEVGTDYMVIDDGSGPVRVDTSTLASPPAQGSYVTVIGMSSLYKTESDHRRLVLPRGNGDVSTW